MQDKKITFPDREPFLIKQKSEKEISNFNISKNKINKTSRLSNNISNYITFLIENNLLPNIPNELKVVYVKDNSFFTLSGNKKLSNNVSIEPFENYSYPACMSPTTNTLYLSNDLELESNIVSNLWNKTLKLFNHSESNTVLNYREIFNQDNQKVVEYIIGHELGHFFLQLKNKDKNLLSRNKIIEKCALNIEEAFSESFSLQIMCLKNKGIEVETNNFQNIQQYRLNSEKHRLRFFKDYPNNKDIMEYQQYFNEQGIDKLLNSYDFPLIYKSLPFKDNENNLENNINNIYDKCYLLALNNNREAIKIFINNKIFNNYNLTKVFENELQKSVGIAGKNNSIDELITLIHEKLNGMSFSTQKISGLRERFLEQDSTILKKNKK